MLHPPFPWPETADLKAKKGSELGMSGEGGEKGEGVYACECVYVYSGCFQGSNKY